MDELSNRSAQDVLDDHLDLAQGWGDEDDIWRILEEDMRRNVSEDCVILTNRGVFRGHEGVRQLARMLAEELRSTGPSSTPIGRWKEEWRFWNGPTRTTRPG